VRSFQDRVAIVTGAASGLGREIVLQLAAEGAVVVATDIDGAGAARVAEDATRAGGRARGETLDVTREADVVARFEAVRGREGRLDYAFNNAGIALLGELRDVSLPQCRRVLEVDLWGVLAGSHAAYRIMAAQGSGHIVNTASLAGLVGFPAMQIYAVAKAAVVELTLGLRVEGRALGVTATALCPGFIESGIYEAADLAAMDRVEALRRLPVAPVQTARAVRALLAGVRHDRAIVTYPAYARILWWIRRFAPALHGLGARKALKRLRRARRI
jgi:NAD(P)-dependent dehydrogenase (short-subunit alcohol dehydrogenase family)